ncbi:hypothetical protein EVAR_90724_1 [Eumeta japonica]|uniref:Uncharacterized protein n=1 Tax=Eumeta variegata TaxID=151549 RepID=A0A4C2A429_EUMVA|nr:hypothetical protein EVAR_90724_1 [Eumeta japonica]
MSRMHQNVHNFLDAELTCRQAYMTIDSHGDIDRPRYLQTSHNSHVVVAALAMCLSGYESFIWVNARLTSASRGEADCLANIRNTLSVHACA